MALLSSRHARAVAPCPWSDAMTPAPNSTAARGASPTGGSAGPRDGVEAGRTADIASQRHVFARLVQATSRPEIVRACHELWR